MGTHVRIIGGNKTMSKYEEICEKIIEIRKAFNWVKMNFEGDLQHDLSEYFGCDVENISIYCYNQNLEKSIVHYDFDIEILFKSLGMTQPEKIRLTNLGLDCKQNGKALDYVVKFNNQIYKYSSELKLLLDAIFLNIDKSFMA